MTDISMLKSKFDVPGKAMITEGNGGLTKVTLTSGDSEADIYLNGACVTRFDVQGRSVIFCSETSKWETGKAIRGGIPVIFPWFGPHPTDPKLPQHGFARAANWNLVATDAGAGNYVSATLELASSELTRASWPYDFILRYTVTVGPQLNLEMTVKNTGSSPFQYDEALHTYFTVSDVRKITITGLEQTEYVDKVDKMTRKREGDERLTLKGETDRVYVNTTSPCSIHDPKDGRILIEKAGSHATVVWNPWETKAEALPDLAGGQWPKFVCVETVNTLESAISLAPSQTHTLRAFITPS